MNVPVCVCVLYWCNLYRLAYTKERHWSCVNVHSFIPISRSIVCDSLYVRARLCVSYGYMYSTQCSLRVILTESAALYDRFGLPKVQVREIDMRVLCVKYGAIRIVIRLIHDQYYVVSCWFQNVLLFVLFLWEYYYFFLKKTFRVAIICCCFIYCAASISLGFVLSYSDQFRPNTKIAVLFLSLFVESLISSLGRLAKKNNRKNKTNSIATPRKYKSFLEKNIFVELVLMWNYTKYWTCKKKIQKVGTRRIAAMGQTNC